MTPVGPDQLQVELGTAAAPVLTCDFVYQLVAPSTLDLVKVIQGDAAAQQGNATISASCDDGATATLTVTPGQATPAGLATALAIPFPAVCQISETATGAALGASVHDDVRDHDQRDGRAGEPAMLTVGSDTSSACDRGHLHQHLCRGEEQWRWQRCRQHRRGAAGGLRLHGERPGSRRGRGPVRSDRVDAGAGHPSARTTRQTLTPGDRWSSLCHQALPRAGVSVSISLLMRPPSTEERLSPGGAPVPRLRMRCREREPDLRL